MPGNNKKPIFGTLSAVTLFLVTFLALFVLLTWMVLTLGFRITGSNSSDFGAGIFVAVAVVPTLNSSRNHCVVNRLNCREEVSRQSYT